MGASQTLAVACKTSECYLCKEKGLTADFAKARSTYGKGRQHDREETFGDVCVTYMDDGNVDKRFACERVLNTKYAHFDRTDGIVSMRCKEFSGTCRKPPESVSTALLDSSIDDFKRYLQSQNHACDRMNHDSYGEVAVFVDVAIGVDVKPNVSLQTFQSRRRNFKVVGKAGDPFFFKNMPSINPPGEKLQPKISRSTKPRSVLDHSDEDAPPECASFAPPRLEIWNEDDPENKFNKDVIIEREQLGPRPRRSSKVAVREFKKGSVDEFLGSQDDDSFDSLENPVLEEHCDITHRMTFPAFQSQVKLRGPASMDVMVCLPLSVLHAKTKGDDCFIACSPKAALPPQCFLQDDPNYNRLYGIPREVPLARVFQNGRPFSKMIVPHPPTKGVPLPFDPGKKFIAL